MDQMMSGALPTNGVNNMEEDLPADPIAAVKPPVKEKKKKKSGAFGLFRAALSMVRKRPRDPISYDKSTPASNANWTKLVDSVRPLHSQENIPSPPPSVTSESSPIRPSAAENMKEMIPPPSPAASSSSAGTMSQYASAVSLRDLVDSSDDEEEEDPDEVFDALCGDEMIDAKADEFIAQFYQQLRLQNKGNHHDS